MHSRITVKCGGGVRPCKGAAENQYKDCVGGCWVNPTPVINRGTDIDMVKTEATQCKMAG